MAKLHYRPAIVEGGWTLYHRIKGNLETVRTKNKGGHMSKQQEDIDAKTLGICAIVIFLALVILVWLVG